MKRSAIIALFVICATHAFAQETTTTEEKKEVKKGGFKKENLITGGSLNVGLGNGTTSFGISPYFGYSINKYIDAGISLNYDYISQKQYVFDYSVNDYAYLGKLRQNVIGPGAFVKIFPVKFLYVQAQYEENFITYKFLPGTNSGYAYQKQTASVGSFLLGAGLAQGRSQYDRSYGYISVLFDVTKNPNSPYLDGYGNVTPIFRAGYNIALFQGQGLFSGGRKQRSRRF